MKIKEITETKRIFEIEGDANGEFTTLTVEAENRDGEWFLRLPNMSGLYEYEVRGLLNIFKKLKK